MVNVAPDVVLQAVGMLLVAAIFMLLALAWELRREQKKRNRLLEWQKGRDGTNRDSKGRFKKRDDK